MDSIAIAVHVLALENEKWSTRWRSGTLGHSPASYFSCSALSAVDSLAIAAQVLALEKEKWSSGRRSGTLGHSPASCVSGSALSAVDSGAVPIAVPVQPMMSSKAVESKGRSGTLGCRLRWATSMFVREHLSHHHAF